MLKDSNCFKIDNTTWNDLNMDAICTKLDKCNSSVGSEYLRESMRTLLLDEDLLKVRSEQADFLSTYSDTAKIRKIFSSLGRIKKVSFRDYIFRLGELKPQSNVKHFILIILLLAVIAMIFINPLIGIIGLVIMFAINISTYFADKSKIEAYFNCIKYLAGMVVASRKLAVLALSGTPFESYSEELKQLYKLFSSVEKGSWLITNSVSGSITDVIMDYVRMLFHVDLIKFNSMRKIAMDNCESIDRLYNILGEIELTNCISEFRKDTGYVKPEFSGNKNSLAFADLVHPLVKVPVENSLSTEKSVLLTGSNASGKSTFLKSVAINQIFAQTIYTCMASHFQTAFYKVISSMALNDNLFNNESYFVVEIKSLKRVFDETGDIPVMCFIDEVLRGTNTKERIAASSVILKALSQKNSLVFAATHDIELTELLKDYMSNYHFSETVSDTQVIFDYKLKKGPSTTRNAIKLLEVYGFDADIIAEARSLAE